MPRGLGSLVTLAFLLAGCADSARPLDEEPEGAPGGSTADPSDSTANPPPPAPPPERVLPAVLSKLVPVVSMPTPGGYRTWLWEDFAYVATFTSEAGIVIFNVSNPEKPVEAGRLAGQFGRGVDTLDYGKRLVITVNEGGPLHFYDVTDPAQPERLATFDIMSHNAAVHPTSYAVYNSRSLGPPPGALEIYDASNPDDIRLHKVWEFERLADDGSVVLNGGCHEVVVYADVQRAYCAAVEQTLVWDIVDPFNPRILTVIDHPLIESHHTAFTILNHSVLVLSDEAGDGFVDACFGGARTQQADASPPLGTLWFYDLTTTPPTYLSSLAPPPIEEPLAYCSSHTGSEVGNGTGYIAYGWVTNGALLIDAKDPKNPRLLDQVKTGGGVWDARYHRGYVFTADDTHGMQVLRPE